jgi:hypothetical protein
MGIQGMPIFLKKKKIVFNSHFFPRFVGKPNDQIPPQKAKKKPMQYVCIAMYVSPSFWKKFSKCCVSKLLVFFSPTSSTYVPTN